jgi:hypothetical protein
MAYNFQFPDISQHSGQHAAFFERHSREHRLDSEQTSHFSGWILSRPLISLLGLMKQIRVPIVL